MSRLRRPLASVLVVGLAGLISGSATVAAFSSTAQDGGNAFEVGTTVLQDDDAGAAMLTLTDARPGDTAEGCILVTYTGTLDASVVLYGNVTDALAPYLALTVTRGSDAAPSFPSCAGFVPDPGDPYGLGPGVLYRGPLSDYPGSYASGIVDPDPLTALPEVWTTGEAHAYRFEVTMGPDPAAQGLTASAVFAWEARNL